MSERERQEHQGERDNLVERMVDVLQELGMTQEDISAAWTRVEQERKEGHAWGQEWVDRYGE